jgi:hypothetical protein
MNRLAQWLARFYPRWWRARYGQELDALLEDSSITMLDLFGVVRSAVEMRMSTNKSPRLVEMACRDIPHGYELESSVEFARDDGGRTLVRYYCREIDLGDSYLTLSHTSRGSAPAQTILVYGKKGEVDGDFRSDETEMLVLHADGTIQRTEQTVKTWLKYQTMVDRMRDKFRSGLSAEDILRQIRRASDNPAWS